MKIRELISEVGVMQQIGSIAKDVGAVGSMIKKDFTAAKDATYNKLTGRGSTQSSTAATVDYKYPLNKLVSGQLLTSSESKSVEDLIMKLDTGKIKSSTVAPAAAVQALRAAMKGSASDLDTIKKLIQDV